jgi:hypothetical protein
MNLIARNASRLSVIAWVMVSEKINVLDQYGLRGWKFKLGQAKTERKILANCSDSK